MSYKVSAQSLNKIKLNETDTAASVLQNLAIILSTVQGTVPMYRDFGISQRSVDKPIPVAKAMLIADIEDAIRKFEPRATLRNINFAIDEANPGKLIPTVEVEINAES